MAGYLETPLVKKLGIKENFRVRTRSAPGDYSQMITPYPESVTISDRLQKDIYLYHVFTKSRSDLDRLLPRAMGNIRQNGMIWVSWPKKSSGVKSDVTEDVIREIARPLGLVDVKVCAVDAIWSGLKLVIRKGLRK